MEQQTLLPIAAVNLRKLETFLVKLTEVCDAIPPDAPGSAAQEARLAIAQLTRMTGAILANVDHCSEHGGTFQAWQTLNDVLGGGEGAAAPPDGAAARSRIIMEMCLQQGEAHRRRAARLESQLSALRRAVNDVYAELQAARTALDRSGRSAR
jgi:hypothetical protein